MVDVIIRVETRVLPSNEARYEITMRAPEVPPAEDDPQHDSTPELVQVVAPTTNLRGQSDDL